MKKLNLFISLLALLLLLFCFASCSVTSNGDESNVENIDASKYYKITENVVDDQTSYTYVIYDSNGNTVLEENTTKEPRIRYVSDGVLEILTSHGSPAALCRYYDIQNNVLSQPFWNPSLVEGHTIVYMDFDENRSPNTLLIVRDIFDKNELYKEIERDFSPTGAVSMAVESVKFVARNTIELVYLKGKDFVSTTEKIDL